MSPPRRAAVLTASLSAFAVVGPAAAAPATAHANGDAPTFARSACGSLPDGVRAGRDLLCGVVRVPRRHSRPDGPKIRLGVRVVRSTSQRPRTPVLLLGGGPGENVTDVAPALAAARPFRRLRTRHDVVVLDQRGAGRGRPSLYCTRELRALAPEAGLDGVLAAYRACAARLERTTDLAGFRSLESARDLDVVRRALGYRRMHVFGTSQGTKVSLLAARRSPRWIASLTLASPVPAEANFLRDAPLSFDRALGRLAADCAAARACDGPSPDLPGKLEATFARLATQPAPLPPGNALAVGALSVDILAALLFAAFYDATAIPELPAVITRLAAGDYSDFARTQDDAPLPGAGLADGMYRAFTCAEEFAVTTPAFYARRLAGLSSPAQVLGLTSPSGLPGFAVCDAFRVRRPRPPSGPSPRGSPASWSRAATTR